MAKGGVGLMMIAKTSGSRFRRWNLFHLTSPERPVAATLDLAEDEKSEAVAEQFCEPDLFPLQTSKELAKWRKPKHLFLFVVQQMFVSWVT
mmetsp:Transcript_23981/g.66575  ORF Transcript_23981/g.66575 Transcript_23981/m.66575 type:complete len:91 (-) Transcript_23981:778-1050(-)